MAKTDGYDFDSDQMTKIGEQAGKIGNYLFHAKLAITEIRSIIGLRPTWEEEQQMLNLVINMYSHIIDARKCAEKLGEGIHELFEENDLRYGVSFNIYCKDCGTNTMDDANQEYYMVQDALWALARTNPVNKKPKLPVTATLCIGCLEERLGRQITSADFQYTIGKRSARLQDRTKELPPENITWWFAGGIPLPYFLRFRNTSVEAYVKLLGPFCLPTLSLHSKAVPRALPRTL
jgi:hypothetical protein